MENFNFGWASSGLTIIMNLLPIFSFINFYSNKSNFDNIPASKIFTNYANCLVWYFYGKIIFNTSIKIANLIGAIISLILIIIYLIFEAMRKYFLDFILNITIIIIGTLSSFEWFCNIIFENDIAGQICLIISFICILTQIPDIYNGIKEKNHLLIRINYSIIGFPTHFCWIIFGFIIGDFYVLIANLFGIISSIFQIMIYTYFKKESSIINGENIASTIGIDEETRKETNISKAKPVEIVNLE